MPELTPTCAVCGGVLQKNALGGLCPKCLMEAALEQDNGEPAPERTQTEAETPVSVERSKEEGKELLEGIRYFSDYELLKEIGRGAMGVVFKARQISLNRTVALKIIPGAQLASAKRRQRLHFEGEVVANLDHPNIVPIYEVGSHDGFDYFCMKLIEDGNLAQRMAELNLAGIDRKSVSAFRDRETRVGHLVAKIASAVHHAHQRGILHRDIKPGNILIDQDGEPYVADFGLAKVIEAGSDLASTGGPIGTPHYMAPERLTGGSHFSISSDVYSVGAILYELMLGKPPVEGATPWQIAIQMDNSLPARPRNLNPGIDPDLETIVLKCLEYESQQRYASASALAEDLNHWLRGEPIQARAGTRIERTWKWARRNRTVVTLGTTVVIALIVGLIGTTAGFLKATDAHQEAARRLFDSYLDEARANRFGNQTGRRFESLMTLQKANGLRKTIDLGREDLFQLKDEVVASLALQGDLKQIRERTFEDSAWFAAVSPDLNLFVRQVDGEEVMNLYRFGRKTPLATIPGSGASVTWPRFSPSGNLLGAVYDSSVYRIWDISEPTHPKLVHKSPCAKQPGSLDFDSDGDRLAVTVPSGDIAIKNVHTGRTHHQFSLPSKPKSLRFHPKGRHLSVVNGSRVDLWSMKTGKRERRFELPDVVCGVAWHPSGRLLAAGCVNERIYILEAKSGRRLRELEGHRQRVNAVSFNRTGDLLASWSWDGTSRLWDPATGKELVRAPGRFRRFSKDDGQLAYCSSYAVGVWEVGESESYHTFHDPQRGEGIYGAAIGVKGRLLASCGSEGVRVWDIQRERVVEFLPTGPTRSVLFHQATRSLITSAQNGVSRWPIQKSGGNHRIEIGQPERLIDSKGEPFSYNWAALSGDQRFLAAVKGPKKAVVFDLEKSRTQVILEGHDDLASVALSRKGRWAATGTWQETGVWIWDCKTGEKVIDLWEASGGAQVAFDPSGRWMLAATGRAYRLWEVGKWHEPVWEVVRDVGGDSPGLARFAPGGEVLVLETQRSKLDLVESQTVRPLLELNPPDTAFFGWPAVDGQGKQLAVPACSDNVVQLWNLGRIERELARRGLGTN